MKPMPLADLLSDLPAWAQAVAYSAFGVGLAVMYLVGKAGWKQGLKSLPAESEARVAAVVVEPAALLAATAAIEALNMTFMGIQMTLKSFCAVVERNIEVHKRQNELLENLTREIIIANEVEARIRPR